MKRNQPAQHSVEKAQVRLVDIGQRIEFFPERRQINPSIIKIKRHLPSAAVSLVTFGLVLYLTLGNGAAIAGSQVSGSAADPASKSAALAKGDLLLSHIDNSQELEILRAESLSRGLSNSALLNESIAPATETLASETTAPTEPVQETAASQPAETRAETQATTKSTTKATTQATTAATTKATTAATTKATTEATTATPTTAAPAAAAASSALTADQQQALIELSRSLIGVPYVYGGTSKSGLDCSGFTLYIYDKLFGITLEHQASAQASTGIAVKKADVQVGDILCFDWDHNGSCDHVGLYIGNNHYVNASRSRGKVCELVADFGSDPIMTIRRIIY